MCRKFFHRRASNLNNQQGASLVMAVFMIVVFSMMAAVMVKIISSSSQSISYEVLGTRAYTAAKIGNQWALQKLFPLNDTGSCLGVTSNTPPTLSTISGLETCEIAQLTCEFVVVDSTTYFTIVSTGQCGSGDTLTTRTLKIEARSL